ERAWRRPHRRPPRPHSGQGDRPEPGLRRRLGAGAGGGRRLRGPPAGREAHRAGAV
ncbi:MAG: hypothetical protein AVDCRST_MAG10-201, partial [uncultured Acidimicrobiales bacterium]